MKTNIQVPPELHLFASSAIRIKSLGEITNWSIHPIPIWEATKFIDSSTRSLIRLFCIWNPERYAGGFQKQGVAHFHHPSHHPYYFRIFHFFPIQLLASPIYGKPLKNGVWLPWDTLLPSMTPGHAWWSMWRGPPDHPRCDLGGTSLPSVCTSESFHRSWDECGMIQTGEARRRHGSVDRGELSWFENSWIPQLGSGMVWVCFDCEMIVKLCLSWQETSQSN